MKKLIYLFIISFAFSHCAKDKGNYDYLEINEITVKGVKDKYEVQSFNTLTIKPTIEETKAGSDYSYLWYMYPSSLADKIDTLSYEKELNKEISGIPGLYILKFKITDNATGIYHVTEFELELTNDFSKGILILGENGGEASLNFINSSGKILKDVYKGVNGQSLGTNPLKVSFVESSSTEFNEIVIVCDDADGGAILSAISLYKKHLLREAFIIEPDVFKPQTHILWSDWKDYIVNNGRIHIRSLFGIPYGNDQFGHYPTGDYYLSPISLVGKTHSFYDSKNQRILAIASNAGKAMTTISTAPGFIGAAFDQDNVGLDIVYSGIGAGNVMFGLFKDNANNFFALTMNLFQNPRRPIFIEPTGKEQITSLMGIDNASAFATDVNYSGYLFYAENNKLYAFNFNTNTTLELMDLGVGYSVDALQLYKEVVDTGDDINHLFVGYNKDSKAGVIDMHVSFDGGLSLTNKADYPQICDKIASIVYQNNL